MEKETTQNSTAAKRRLRGTVVSTKMAKTITVRVDRSVRHPKYGKTYNVSKKYKAHDERGEAHMGDLVEIMEIRPLSKDKRYIYARTITPAIA
ncbi:MAG: 30S ribosomal protein S17 [Patescibacteria group bacterium]|nr:30S ribosomal protein S17 [Patescibacteria group bacterium]